MTQCIIDASTPLVRLSTWRTRKVVTSSALLAGVAGPLATWPTQRLVASLPLIIRVAGPLSAWPARKLVAASASIIRVTGALAAVDPIVRVTGALSAGPTWRLDRQGIAHAPASFTALALPRLLLPLPTPGPAASVLARKLTGSMARQGRATLFEALAVALCSRMFTRSVA